MRRFETWWLIGALALVASAGSAHGAPDPSCPVEGPITADGVTALAEAVWATRDGARRPLLRAGWQAARDALPGRVQGLTLSATPELALDAGSTAEYAGAATLAIELGSRSAARRAALDADWRADAAGLDARRWRFVDAVQAAYLGWRVRALERAHLVDYLAEADAELEPIRAAGERRLISRLDLADLEAEVGRIAAELDTATRDARRARARFDAVLGARCDLAAPQPPASGDDNPWRPLVERAARFPEIAVHDARRAALQARAQAHAAADPWVVDVGVAARAVGSAETFVGPSIALSVPFTDSEGAEAAHARAEARIEESAALAASLRIRAELSAEAADFEALVQSRDALIRDRIAPLEARLRLVEAAFAAAQVEIDRLIRARRDLHEAEHALILLRAEIDARRLAADTVRALLDPETEESPR